MAQRCPLEWVDDMSVPANTIAWDFQSASTPLASKIGQAETFSTVGSPTTDVTDGVKLTGASDGLTLTCTNGGYLTNWTYDYTMFIACKVLGTGANNFDPLFLRTTSGGTAQAGIRMRMPFGDGDVYNNGWNGGNYTMASGAAEVLYTFQLRANGGTLWEDAASIGSSTGQSLTIFTQNTSDIIKVGPGSASAIGVHVHGIALMPGWNSADLTDLTTNWRTYLGIGGNSGAMTLATPALAGAGKATQSGSGSLAVPIPTLSGPPGVALFRPYFVTG